MTAITVDPAATIAAAGRDLLDQLREFVDHESADDVPGLLDRLGKLLGSTRRKVNRVLRAAEPPVVEKPAPAEQAVSAAPAAAPVDAAPKVEPAKPEPARAIPAATPAPARITVPVRPAKQAPVEPASTPIAAPPQHGRHRARHASGRSGDAQGMTDPAPTPAPRKGRFRIWLFAALAGMAIVVAIILVISSAQKVDEDAWRAAREAQGAHFADWPKYRDVYLGRNGAPGLCGSDDAALVFYFSSLKLDGLFVPRALRTDLSYACPDKLHVLAEYEAR